MKYILYNIRNLARNEKFIFAIMLICVFVSAWIMTFAYGLYQNYHALVVEGEDTGKQAHPDIVEEMALTYGEIKAYLEALPDELLSGTSCIICMTNVCFEDGYLLGEMYDQNLYSRFTVRNGNYQTSSFIEELWKSKGILVSGRFFTDEDEMSGNDCIMVGSRTLPEQEFHAQYSNVIIDDSTVLLYGKEYKIIGTHNGFEFTVPFLSVPAETTLSHFFIDFEKPMTKKIYNTLIHTANEVIPGKLSFPELELPDSESLYIYHNIMMISVFIAALTIVNFAFLYNFIFSKRKRQLAIMRICGCTAGRAVRICLGECIMLCVPVFLAGMLTYIPFMKYVLSPLFEYMADSYSLWIYAAIFGIYFVMMLIIMGILLSGQIRKTLAEGRKEAA